MKNKQLLAFEDPSFLGRNLLAGISFGQTTTTPSFSTLKTDKLYFAPKVGFPLSRDSNLSIEYSFDQEDVKLTSNTVSPLIKLMLAKRIKVDLFYL